MWDKIRVAIHQPNFFPWLGYFDKICRSDIFIFLDNVQFPKTGGTWCNRVQILMNDQVSWLTLPIVRNYSGVKPISEMTINNHTDWRIKLLKTIQMNYSRTPCYKQIFPILANLIHNQTTSLAAYNISTIRTLSAALGIDTGKFILGSEIIVEGKATELLISMTKAVKGSTYICGGGSEGYQEDEKFAAAGIELIYQNFQHPVYHQHKRETFIPGLSIIDTLMNCGIQGTRDILCKQYSEVSHA